MVKRFLLAVLMALLVAVPASAAYYEMSETRTGAAFIVSSSVTTSDFIRVKARAWQKLSFTKGSAFGATLYACDTDTYAAATCVSKNTLSASTDGVDVSTGKRWLIFDVTAAETGSNLSYLTFQSNADNAGGGGGGSGILEGTFANLPADNSSGSLYYVTDCADATCAAGGGTVGVTKEWDGAAWSNVATGSGIASVSEDASPTLGGNLDPDGNSIGSRNYYVTTEAEWEAALTALGDGVGVAGQTGGTINLVGDIIDITDGVTLCTATAGTGGRNGLKIVGRGPGAPGNSDGQNNGATIVRWVGANGGDLLSAGSCNSLEIEGVVLQGRSCVDANLDDLCDSDGVTAMTQAANLLQVLNTSGGPLKLNLHDVVLTGSSDYAIKGNTSGQWDDTTLENTIFYDNNGNIHFASSQSAGMTLGPNVIMTYPAVGATNPHIYQEYGEISFNNSYFGFNADGQIGVLIGTNAVRFSARESVCETDDETGTKCFDSEVDAPTNGGIQNITLIDNKVIWDEGGAAFATLAARGKITIRDNQARQTGSTSGLTPPTITIARDAGFAGNTLKLDIQNNFDYRVRADYTGYALPELWAPTIGAGVLFDPGSVASAALPNTSSTDCLDGTIGIDIDDGSLKVCEADAWIDPPNLLATAPGTLNYVPYYTGANTIGNESVFTYNASTNTLRAQIVQGANGLVAGVDDTTDGVISIHDNSTNNQINLYPGNPVTDLDFLLPDDYGLAGDCIATDGAGTLYFDTCGASGGNVNDNTAEAITGVWEIQDDTRFNVGNDADWGFEFDEGVDNQLLLQQLDPQANDPTATTDPSFEILVEATPPADQQVFGIAKGSQATNTPLLTVDEDGDVVAAGGVTAASYDSPADATAGGSLVLKEGADDGSNTLTIRIPDSGGLSGTVIHTVTAGGKLPANSVAHTFTECFPIYAPTDTIADTDDITSLWRAPAAVTITEVWCETNTGTVTADLQIDDGSPADVMGTDLVCDTTGETDSTGLTGGMADGDRLDLAITAVASSPTRLTFCAEYTYN